MSPFESSPLRRTFPLPDGPRVRLRLARRSDLPAVRELLASRGVTASDLEVLRLLSFDPAERTVLCAFAPMGGEDTLVGAGAIELRAGAEPDTLVVDERLVDGLGGLLGEVLADRAATRGRRVA